jgi:hypothetical protein
MSPDGRKVAGLFVAEKLHKKSRGRAARVLA